MLKILTDPTVYPQREVALQRADGTLAVTGVSDAGGFEDLAYPRPDGGSNIIYRPRRTDLAISVDALGFRAVEQLEELAGSSQWGRTRTPVQVSAWFDKHTWLYAPLTGTLKALKRNVATSLLEKITLTHTRASVLDIEDEAGNVKSLASGELGYMPSVIGPGAYTHYAYHDNLLALPHATGAPTLGWSSGTATLSWDTTQRSPYRAAGGVLRAEVAASTAWQLLRTHETGSAATDTHYLVAVELRGRGRVLVRAGFGITSTDSATVDLNEQWQTIHLAVAKTTAVSVIVIYVIGESVLYQSTVFVGRCGLYYEAAGASPLPYRPVPAWQNSGSRADDVISTPFSSPGPNGTLTIAGRLPLQRFSYPSLFRLQDVGQTQLGMYWNLVNPAYFFITHGGVSAGIYSTSHNVDYVPGAPFILVARHVSDGFPRLDLFTAGKQYSAVGTAPSNLYTVGTTAQIAQHCQTVVPQHFRYDGRVWSDTEVRSYGRLMESEALRPLLLRTAGRKFLIADIDLAPVSGRRQELSGTITLQQHDRDLDFAIGR